MADFDGDGVTDVISGSWPGQIYMWRGLGDGRFEELGSLRDAHGARVVAGAASAVAVADWDADGDLDLVVGTKSGAVSLLSNLGELDAVGRPTFATPVELGNPEGTLRTQGGNAGPAVADWDGDGCLDLVLGGAWGEVNWYRGSRALDEAGKGGALRLGTAQPLIPGLDLAEYRKTTRDVQPEGVLERHRRSGQRVKPCVVDWNGDGRMDLLLGDFAQEWGPAPELGEAELAQLGSIREASKLLTARGKPLYQAILARVEAAANAHQAQFGIPMDPDERDRLLKRTESEDAAHTDVRREAKTLSAARRALTKRSDRHGWVWVHLRSPNAKTSTKPISAPAKSRN